ncbi:MULTISPECIES: bile acid:sodium symporter family protein [Clostridium]|uniref:bile acid:sodium symporter family protein n=1 Tax=Clostridium TaxID=1485 RepID=UPI00069FDFCF|nr:bile acid:sodium symporter family protein [Clostridium sp. DMHC 10]KOF57375.1 symporter [Clostridium sp. DMHC 10]MCD2347078.1 bile acid:sodium symporter family protein [Clostridium guangxiense]
MIEKISKLCNKYFALLVILVAAIGLFRPSTFLWVVPKVSLLLGIIMFGMGMTLKKEDFKEVFTRPKDVLIGVVAHYIIMPCIAYLLCVALRLPKEIAVGVILVGCCPSGTASNVMCFIAGGDLALSVCISSVSTLLAPLFTPLLILLLAGKWVSIPVLELFIDIAKIVILPIVLGVVVNKVAGNASKEIVKFLPIVSVVAIVLIVGGVVGANSKKLITTAAISIGAVVLHNLFGFLFGYLAAKVMKMDEAKRRAVAFEVGMQNSALGVSLAMSFFSPLSAIPAAIFSVWHNISGPTLASFWANKQVFNNVENTNEKIIE